MKGIHDMDYRFAKYIAETITSRIGKGWLIVPGYEKLFTYGNMICCGAIYDMMPRDPQFGILYAYFRYADETDDRKDVYYKLQYTIRRKGNTRPVCSNCPTDLQTLEVQTAYGMEFVLPKDIPHVIEAFQMFMPTKDLMGFDRALRESMLKIRHWVAKTRLCGKVRYLEKHA